MCPHNYLERNETQWTLMDFQIYDVPIKKKKPERYWNVSG
jgi:hypothetical protein